MRNKRLMSAICIGTLAIGLLVGCRTKQGREEPVGSIGTDSTISATEGVQEETWEPTDWMQGGLQMPIEGARGHQNWGCLDTLVIEKPEPDFVFAEKTWSLYTGLGSRFYLMDKYILEQNEDRYGYLLYRIEGETKEVSMVEPFWEESEDLWIYDIEAVSDRELAVFCRQEENDYVMFYDVEDRKSRVLDLNQAKELTQSYWREQWCDSQGHVYVLTEDINDPYLYIFGEKDVPGQAQLLRTIELDEKGRTWLYSRLPDGTPLVLLGKKAVYIDMESGKDKELAAITANHPGIIDEQGIFYSNWNPEVKLWNPANGDFDHLISFKDYGIDYKKTVITLGINKAGELLALTEKEDKPVLYFFGPVREAEGTLRLANLWYHDLNVKSAATTYSIEHPDCQIAYESDWENAESFYERIMAQMVSDQGPDLLFVHMEDLDKLNAKGALADLADVLEDNTKEQLFAGVMTAGLRGEKLVGLPGGISGNSLVTVDGNWQGEAWTLEEAVQLWQQKKKQGARRFLPENLTQEEMLDYLVLSDMASMPFIDWEKNECDFDNDLFRQTLEMIGERQISEHRNLDVDEEYETARQVTDGVYLADAVWGASLIQYTSLMGYYNGNAHFAGFPTQDGNGNILGCYGFIVVNAKTQHWEEVADFLQYMYGKEFQSKDGRNLMRKDVLREALVPESNDDKYELDTITNMLIPLKKDGSSYVEDYIAFMDSCRAEYRDTEDIKKIIREEAGNYFNKTQSLDNAVKVIENRVQLYLDENR